MAGAWVCRDGLCGGHPGARTPSAALGWARGTGPVGAPVTQKLSLRPLPAAPWGRPQSSSWLRVAWRSRARAWGQARGRWGRGRSAGGRDLDGPGAGTHVVFLALQLLRKVVLVGLQLVQGVPQLLGLVPRKWPSQAGPAEPRTAGPWPPSVLLRPHRGPAPATPQDPRAVGSERAPPAPAPGAAPSPQLVLAEVVDVERLASLGQHLLLHLPGRLLLASLLVSLGGHGRGAGLRRGRCMAQPEVRRPGMRGAGPPGL